MPPVQMLRLERFVPAIQHLALNTSPVLADNLRGPNSCRLHADGLYSRRLRSALRAPVDQMTAAEPSRWPPTVRPYDHELTV